MSPANTTEGKADNALWPFLLFIIGNEVFLLWSVLHNVSNSTDNGQDRVLILVSTEYE